MRAAVISLGLMACGGGQAKSRPPTRAQAVDAGPGAAPSQLAREEDELRALDQQAVAAQQALAAARTDAERDAAAARLAAVTRERDEVARRIEDEKLRANPLFVPLDDDR